MTPSSRKPIWAAVTAAATFTAVALVAGCGMPSETPTRQPVVRAPVASHDLDPYTTLSSGHMRTVAVTPGGPTPIPIDELTGRIATKPILRGESLGYANTARTWSYRSSSGEYAKYAKSLTFCAEFMFVEPVLDSAKVDVHLLGGGDSTHPRLLSAPGEVRIVRVYDGADAECEQESERMVTVTLGRQAAYDLVEHLGVQSGRALIVPSATTSGRGPGEFH